VGPTCIKSGSLLVFGGRPWPPLDPISPKSGSWTESQSRPDKGRAGGRVGEAQEGAGGRPNK
jgi:hypothetical protein